LGGDVGVDLAKEVIQKIIIFLSLYGLVYTVNRGVYRIQQRERYLWFRLGLGSPFCEVVADAPVVGVTLGLFFLTGTLGYDALEKGVCDKARHVQTCLARSASTRQIIPLTVGLVPANPIPFFAAVVGITLAIVVDNEVVLVESVTNNLLVAVLVNLVVEIRHLGNLVAVEGLFACLAEGTKLSELGPVVDL
jgi:hypothetical protein